MESFSDSWPKYVRHPGSRPFTENVLAGTHAPRRPNDVRFTKYARRRGLLSYLKLEDCPI